MPFDPSAINPNDLHSFTEAARLVGRCPQTVANWCAAGLFEALGGSRGRRRQRLIRGADLLRVVVGDRVLPEEIESPAKRRRREAKVDQELRRRGVIK